MLTVHQLAEVVLLAYLIEKVLFRCTLKGDINLIRHQEIRPVFGNGLGESGGQLGAVDMLQTVVDAVVMEAADSAPVPLIPEVNKGIPIRGDGSVAKIFQCFDNIDHAFDL